MTKPPSKDINRLYAHRMSAKHDAIETYAGNKHVPAHVEMLWRNDKLPGVQSVTYTNHTHCLTVKYIGLSMQWYLHTEQCLIQNGNDKPWKFVLKSDKLLRMLSEGRNAFIKR
jgi:hypothetical protein